MYELYELEVSTNAEAGLEKLKRSEPAAFKKARALMDELMSHPCTGTGKPKLLAGCAEPTWSRKITQKHRLTYRVYDHRVVVLVLSAYGHYQDK